MTGKTISHYRILEKLGEGGMGVVYKAEDARLKRPVAIKFFSPQALGTEDEKVRFILEARAAAALDHPNICTVHEIDENEGRTFIVMAYIEGYTLQETVEMDPLNVDDALDIAIQVAEGLQEAHEKGIVHRDIKLSNIMIAGRGQAKITDFGLAKLLGHTGITETGTIIGTVEYMSPEQARGEPVDHRTDIWSLGVVLYIMLTGELPFRGDTSHAVIYSIMNEDPVQMAHWQPAIPASLEQAVRKMMQKDPLKRYEDMGVLIKDLQSIRKDPAAVLVSEELAGPLITRRTPFVGRESEREELRRFLNRAKSGNGALVMLGGEPGVGKTRMTEELEAEAERHGFLSLIGHCYEMEGAPSYIPFIEILQSIMRVVEPDVLLDTLGTAAPEAAKLVPELRQQFPNLPEPRKLPPEQERLFLFNNLRDFFERLAKEQPLLLVIEDLHWTDEPTLLLFQHIAQRLSETPVLVVGTYRDTELDAARALAKALEELLRQRMAHDVLLKRLPQNGVSAMLQGRSGQEPPSRLVQVIYHETEGNPFFVEEVFNHLAEEEKLFDSEGRWRSDLRIEDADVPRGVLLVIGHRLGRVSEECRRTLARAAVIGRGVSFNLLNEVIELDEDALFDAIEEAERAQLIRSSKKDGEVQLTFVHELIRQTLLNDLSLPRRQRFHQRVAEAIERFYAGALEGHAADLAYHFYQACGDTEKSIEYAVLAAERATAQTAYEDAVEQYQRALQLLEQRQPVDELRRCDLLVALGYALTNAGDPRRAKETFLRVTEIARKLPAPKHFVEAIFMIGQFRLQTGVVDEEVVCLAEEGLALLPEEDSAERVKLLAQLSIWLRFDKDAWERRMDLIEQAHAMARRVGDAQALSYVLLSKLYSWGRPPVEQVADATELVKLGEEARLSDAVVWGLFFRCHYQLELGNIAASEADGETLNHLADDAHLPLFVWNAHLVQAMLALMTGRFEEAERLTLEAFAQGRQFREANAAQYLGVSMFFLGWLRGQMAEVEGMWKSALVQHPEIYYLQPGDAVLHLVLGRVEQARFEFDRLAAHDFADLPQDITTPVDLLWLAELAVAFKDMRRVALLYELFHPYADRVLVAGVNALCCGATTLWLGLLAGTMKRWDAAVAHFEAAIETNASVGARPWLARSQHEYARILIERNAPEDKEEARTLLKEATATYRELGMPTFLENAEALLAKL